MASKRVLLIDDDLVTIGMLEKFLLSFGADPVKAANGRVALEKIAAKPGFNLIITDLEMPELNGVEFLKKIRELHLKIPVIMMSSTPQSDVAQDVWTAGVFDFFAKPLDFSRLRSAIEQAMAVGPAVPAHTPEIAGLQHIIRQNGSFIDWEVAENLVKVLGLEIFRDTVRIFESQAFKDVWVIKAHFKDSDYSRIKTLSHRLAGAALNIGLRRVGIKCKIVETLCAGNDEKILLLIEELIENLKQDLDVLKFMISTKTKEAI